MPVVKVDLPQRAYQIHIGPDMLSRACQLMTDLELHGRALLLSNRKVYRLYGGRTRAVLEKHYSVYPYLIGDGERYKSLHTVEKVLRFLIRNRFERGDTIVALGGGVVGDLAGFAAAVYLRGVNFVQIPTTLLAQVDSSVGGKTAVNDPLGKNLIGSFYQPRLVLADTQTLRTLRQRELLSGLGEIVKYGFIADPQILQTLGKHRQTIAPELIARCCQIKAGIVRADETEKNKRAVLNFGHTIGHALETYTHYRFSHGEAIAIGALAAVYMSILRGHLKYSALDKIQKLYRRLGLPAHTGLRLSADKIYRIIQSDKKVADSRLRMVLLKDIGKPLICPVEYEEIVRALDII
ncbi:MAG: 3-dehydroquinate synthase [Candidatus Margulisbacteria bacterium]|jgi:3-dehydroquinate synthase|nr:3-dehydroquinate synthase [Candidatus Margulisiibacteriota bacterium]